MNAEGVWLLFLLLCLLYACTDRHITWEYDGEKHEIFINKDNKVAEE